MRAKATVIFDGDCGFCTWCAGKLERWVKPPALIVPWQHADLDQLGVSQIQCEMALQWVPRDGAPAAGGRAITALLLASSPPWRAIGALLCLPGMAQLTDRGYEIVAANRHRLPGSTPACAVSSR